MTQIHEKIEDLVTNHNRYYNYRCIRVGRFSDPIQTYLARMEERNPSANKHEQRFLQWLAGKVTLLDRALQYYSGELDGDTYKNWRDDAILSAANPSFRF